MGGKFNTGSTHSTTANLRTLRLTPRKTKTLAKPKLKMKPIHGPTPVRVRPETLTVMVLPTKQSKNWEPTLSEPTPTTTDSTTGGNPSTRQASKLLAAKSFSSTRSMVTGTVFSSTKPWSMHLKLGSTEKTAWRIGTTSHPMTVILATWCWTPTTTVLPTSKKKPSGRTLLPVIQTWI